MTLTMNYTQLTPDYKYRHLATAIYAREMEYFHYDFDRINFQHMVANAPDSPFKDDIIKRITDVEHQMQTTTAILAALWAQVDDQDAYAIAVDYTTQKRLQEDAAQ